MKESLNRFGRSLSAGFAFIVACALLLTVSLASAQTDPMTDAIADVSGYWDAVKVVAIGILLFVLGRRVVKKL